MKARSRTSNCPKGGKLLIAKGIENDGNCLLTATLDVKVLQCERQLLAQNPAPQKLLSTRIKVYLTFKISKIFISQKPFFRKLLRNAFQKMEANPRNEKTEAQYSKGSPRERRDWELRQGLGGGPCWGRNSLEEATKDEAH